jgi:hypothetical protein
MPLQRGFNPRQYSSSQRHIHGLANELLPSDGTVSLRLTCRPGGGGGAEGVRGGLADLLKSQASSNSYY